MCIVLFVKNSFSRTGLKFLLWYTVIGFVTLAFSLVLIKAIDGQSSDGSVSMALDLRGVALKAK